MSVKHYSDFSQADLLSSIWTDGSYNFIFEIENKEYQILGVRQASRRYELVFEVVAYE